MTRITVNNRDPRYDIGGQIVDAHDGSLEYFEGRFYWYGTSYGDNDGFTSANYFTVYSSTDMKAWTPHGNILPERPEGVYYRPYVKYCETTKMYVLWYNWYPVLWSGQFGAAASSTPAGPFRIMNDRIMVNYPEPGDLGLFVDEDQTGYVIYTSLSEKHGISIERLAPDYCSSTLENSGILSRGDEACTLFRRGPLYYALFDQTCCFCPQGSGMKVYTGLAPLGPYTFQGNSNLQDTPCGKTPIINAQQAHVASFPTKAGAIFIWTGDRWGSRMDGVKGHDFQFWSKPLVFQEYGGVESLTWVNEWDFELPD